VLEPEQKSSVDYDTAVSTTADKDQLLLDKGQYVLSVRMDWVDKKANEFVVSAYAPTRISFERTVITDIEEKRIVAFGRKKKTNQYHGGKCEMATGFMKSMFMIYFKNTGSGTWNVTMEFTLL